MSTDGYPTIARAMKGFTATCGHEVLADNDYVVKRPGVFHCSPACADADKSMEITIRLVNEGSLEQLLGGIWGAMFWLVDNGDGTYGVRGSGVADAGNTIGEAFLRVVLEETFKSDRNGLKDLPPAFTADPGARRRRVDGEAARPARLGQRARRSGDGLMKPMGAASSTQQCEAHKQHYPTPTYTELHHVIPQAWQVHWQPSTPPFPGPSPDRPGLILWDSRTVALCRTGHGNVHYWLVQIMRELDALAHYSKLDPDQSATWAKAIAKIRSEARATHRHIVGVDIGYASNAITRYDAAGGKISDLIAHKLWGEI